MKQVYLAALLVVLSSCAHYSHVEMGTGDFSGKQVESCAPYFLLISGQHLRPRLDYALVEHKLDRQHIYSISQRTWPYLYPIYFEKCLVLTLNSEGAKKAKEAEDVPGIEIKKSAKE
ncbi:MAG: hypothetical protein JNL01_01725 [Bdellovibrionales bacterium]|nr:hypothetical protein [Bdellovibrionales bacterium]